MGLDFWKIEMPGFRITEEDQKNIEIIQKKVSGLNTFSDVVRFCLEREASYLKDLDAQLIYKK